MALGIVNSMKLSIEFCTYKDDLLTVMQSYKRTPNNFTLVVRKVKISHVFYLFFINKPSLCRGSKRYSIQNDLYVLHGRSPSKDTIISKIHTFFYNLKHSVETLSVYISLLMMLLNAIIQDDYE